MPHNVPQSFASYFRQWQSWVPLIALITLGLSLGYHELPLLAYGCVAVVLAASVISAVHHAEIVAAKVGEPFGSVVLAIAVTLIEVGLIIMLMTSGGGETASLARDTIFSAVMITMNGIVGLSILAATRGRALGHFNAEGARTALASVSLLAVLTLVLPRFTVSEAGPAFTGTQAAFAAIASLIIYTAFLVTQTSRHRDFFLPVNKEGKALRMAHAEPPSGRIALASFGMLLAGLVGVVGLAKVCSPGIEQAVLAAGLPESFVGVVIALLVLLPEGLAAWKNAREGKLMISLNLGYGSAMASIGLTIPAVILANRWLHTHLLLGLTSLQLVLLISTVVLSAMTLAGRRVTRQQGILHMVLAGAYIFFAMVP